MAAAPKNPPSMDLVNMPSYNALLNDMPTVSAYLRRDSIRATPVWWAKTADRTSYRTEDEDEVIYELDEVALAQLPTRLQDNMREMHLERLRRLQTDNDVIPYRDNSRRHRVNRGLSVRTSSPGTERWIRDTTNRLAAQDRFDLAHTLHDGGAETQCDCLLCREIRDGRYYHRGSTTVQRPPDTRNGLGYESDHACGYAKEALAERRRSATTMTGAGTTTTKNTSGRPIRHGRRRSEPLPLMQRFRSRDGSRKLKKEEDGNAHANAHAHGTGTRNGAKGRQRQQSFLGSVRQRLVQSISKLSTLFRG